MDYPEGSFASYEDLVMLWRYPSTDLGGQSRALKLLQVVSDLLRAEAKKVGKNLDQMIENDVTLATVAKSVVVDVVARTLMTSTDQEPMTQFSQAAGGYSVSGSFLVPGGGIFIKKTELARLGLRRQQVGGIDFYA